MKIIIEIDSHKIATAVHRRDIGAELRGVLERLCNDLKHIAYEAPTGDFEAYKATEAALKQGLHLRDHNGSVCGFIMGGGEFL